MKKQERNLNSSCQKHSKTSTTDSSNFASTSPTRSCSSSSTIICSFLSKKSTRRRVSTGSSWISVWISRPASSWWRRYVRKPIGGKLGQVLNVGRCGNYCYLSSSPTPLLWCDDPMKRQVSPFFFFSRRMIGIHLGMRHLHVYLRQQIDCGTHTQNCFILVWQFVFKALRWQNPIQMTSANWNLFCFFYITGFFLFVLFAVFFLTLLPPCFYRLSNEQTPNRSTTVSSNFASTSPTRSCSSFSTTTCSFSSKKSTNVKVSSGPSSILVWTCKTPSTSWKRYPRPICRAIFGLFTFTRLSSIETKRLWMNCLVELVAITSSWNKQNQPVFFFLSWFWSCFRVVFRVFFYPPPWVVCVQFYSFHFKSNTSLNMKTRNSFCFWIKFYDDSSQKQPAVKKIKAVSMKLQKSLE